MISKLSLVFTVVFLVGVYSVAGGNGEQNKDPDQLHWLISVLQANKLFKNLPNDKLLIAAEAMIEYFIEPGEEVFNEGDKADNFYVIAQGNFFAHFKRYGYGNEIVKLLLPGTAFGELGLLYDQPRSGRVFAAPPPDNTTQYNKPILFALDKDTFFKVIPQKTIQDKRLMYKVLNKMPMLKTLESFQFTYLVDALTLKTYQHAEVFFEEGEPADGMYFVIDGEVSLKTHSNVENKAVLLKLLENGDSFGEIGLVKNTTRTVSAYSLGISQVAFLSKADFDERYGPYMVIENNRN